MSATHLVISAPNSLITPVGDGSTPNCLIESQQFTLHCTSRPKDESFRNGDCSKYLDTFYDTLNHDLNNANPRVWLRKRRDEKKETWTLQTILTNSKTYVIYKEEKELASILSQMKEANIPQYCEEPKEIFDYAVVPLAIYSFSRYTNPANENEYIDVAQLRKEEYVLRTIIRKIDESDSKYANFPIIAEDVLPSKVFSCIRECPPLMAKLNLN